MLYCNMSPQQYLSTNNTYALTANNTEMQKALKSRSESKKSFKLF